MKLTELEPSFLKRTGDRSHQMIDDMSQADGIMFLCPVCFVKNNGAVGTHSIICWNPSVPVNITPGPGRWSMHGTGYTDLTLTATQSSIWLTGPGCGAHFFITNGEIIGA